MAGLTVLEYRNAGGSIEAHLSDGTWIAVQPSLDLRIADQAPAAAVQMAEVDYTETDTAGTYTGAVPIPAGATVLDVQWSNGALWTAGTSATLNVGDADVSDGYFTAIDLKSAPVADIDGGAGGISNFLSSTGSGAYAGLTKTYANGGLITGTVVTVGTTGHAGRSRMRVIYALPATPAAATKA